MTTDEAMNGPCCSCSRVKSDPVTNADGSKSDRWVCAIVGGCGREFIPGTARALPRPPPQCPVCAAPEVPDNTPRTRYACGSSDYDQRPGTFRGHPDSEARQWLAVAEALLSRLFGLLDHPEPSAALVSTDTEVALAKAIKCSHPGGHYSPSGDEVCGHCGFVTARKARDGL